MGNTSKNIIFFIVTVLVVLAILIPLSRKRKITFSVRHPDKLSRIVMSEDTSRLVLKKNKGNWIANDTFPVRKDAISFLLHTLGKIEVKTTLSGRMLQKIKNDSAVKQTSVTVYRGIIPVRRFIMITTPDTTVETIFTKGGSAKYVTVYIPGDEEITFYPFTTRLYYWRNREVFRFLPGEVKKITLADIQHPEQDFETGINNNGQYFFHRLNLPVDTGRIDTMKIQRYLSYFQELSFDDFAHNLTPKEKEEINQRPPRYKLEIITAADDTIRITTIPKIKSLPFSQTDPDLTWARIQPPGELVILKYFRIDPFLKEAGYFYR